MVWSQRNAELTTKSKDAQYTGTLEGVGTSLQLGGGGVDTHNTGNLKDS